MSVALFLSMLAVACSGGGSGADSSASAAPAEPRTPDTCGEYRNLTAEQIAEVFSEKRQVTIYDDTGVRQGSETELYDYYCALPTSDDNHSLFNGEIGGLGAAECGRYLPLDPTAKQSWVTEVRKDENYPESQQSMAVDDFDRACFGLGGADDLLIRVANRVDGSAGFATWTTESRLGYKTGLGLVVFPVQTGSDITHPRDDEIQPGSACSYDPDTDAAVPFQLNTNDQTGSTAASDLYGSYELVASAGASTTTSAQVEALFTNDPRCLSPGETISPHWSNDPGDSGTHNGFVILKNWISPRNPDGATSELSDYELHSADGPAHDDDPIVSSTSAGLTLAGVPT